MFDLTPLTSYFVHPPRVGWAAPPGGQRRTSRADLPDPTS
jgi:hypothetical protein